MGLSIYAGDYPGWLPSG